MTTQNDTSAPRQKPEKTSVITARLPKSLVGRIDEIATATNTTRTSIIWHQLEKFVAENPAPAAPKSGLFA